MRHWHRLTVRLGRWHRPNCVKEVFPEGTVYRFWCGPVFAKLMLRNEPLPLPEVIGARWQRELAERAHERKQILHDVTGQHTWIDANTFQDRADKRRFICAFCAATKEE